MKQSKTEKAVFAKLASQKVELSGIQDILSGVADLLSANKKIYNKNIEAHKALMAGVNLSEPALNLFERIKEDYDRLQKEATKMGLEIPSGLESEFKKAERIHKDNQALNKGMSRAISSLQ